MLMVLRYRLIKVDTINDFSHQHLSKTQRKIKTYIKLNPNKSKEDLILSLVKQGEADGLR